MRIDPRAGSKDYIEPLRRRGVDVEVAHLEAGDMEILGNGPEGPILVGVEHKKLPDLFQCIRDGRFADQLRKMRDFYTVSWLLIEGRMRINRGRLQVQGRSKWRDQPGGLGLPEIFGYISTVCQAGGILVFRTENQQESVEWLRSLNNWWTLKKWEQHRAHLDFYRPDQIGGNPLTQPSFAHKVAFQAPGLGGARAHNVSERFKTVKQMVDATEEEWQNVSGVGKKGAARLRRVWREE
jgi:ERCC4-type nuclease